jgi:hypothetical protein
MLIAFALAATLATCAPGRDCVRFTGTVSRGNEFSRAFGREFVLILRPTDFGWEIAVRDGRLTENIARLTPPFRAVPNPRTLEGWHFRNADNSGPNDGSVNAPQKQRRFIFSPDVGRTISYPPTPVQLSQLEQEGQGELAINSLELGGLVRGKKAHIERMEFGVTLSWPSRWVKGSPK